MLANIKLVWKYGTFIFALLFQVKLIIWQHSIAHKSLEVDTQIGSYLRHNALAYKDTLFLLHENLRRESISMHPGNFVNEL